MNEILLQTIIDNQEKQQKGLDEVKNQLNTIQEKPTQVQVTAPPASTAGVESIVSKGFASIRQLITEQSKAVVHEKRILLFPEFRGAESYRFLFRFLLYALITTYAFFLLRYIVDIWRR